MGSSRSILIHRSQVLTGLRPFHRLYTYEPVPAVLRGERPERPLNAESLGFSCELWGLVQLCWAEASSTRPTAQRLFDHLSSASHTWAPLQCTQPTGLMASAPQIRIHPTLYFENVMANPTAEALELVTR